MNKELKDFLDSKVEQYNTSAFIKDDPICIPHLFTKPQDIEISGLFASIFAWGNRTTIIKKCKDLLHRMDNSPFDFIKNHNETRPEAIIRVLDIAHLMIQIFFILFTFCIIITQIITLWKVPLQRAWPQVMKPQKMD